MESSDIGLNEIFIAPQGHTRCSGCGEIVFQMTDGFIMICPENFLAKLERKRLPKNFNPSELPAGTCPECIQTAQESRENAKEN